MGSKSDSSQTTEQKDLRVGASDEALAIGSNANVTIDNSRTIDENVVDIFSDLITFSNRSLDTVKDVVQGAGSTVAETTKALASTTQLATTGKTSESINPMPIVFAIAGLGALYLVLRK
jgi:hypothetical protein